MTVDIPWLRLGAIAIALIVAWYALRWSEDILGKRLVSAARSPEDAKRIGTVIHVGRRIVTVVFVMVAAMFVLDELRISIAPLLGAAGVVGVAIGLAAQDLAKNFIRGIGLLLENEIRVGDSVELAGKSGIVEELTLSSVRLREYDGTVHFIPASEIKIVSNRSLEFSYATLEIGIGYGADIGAATKAIWEVAESLQADPDWSARILAPIEIAGVDKLGDSSVTIRARIKVTPSSGAPVRRQMLRRLKERFDRDGIEIPYPHLTVVLPARTGQPAADSP